MLFVVGGGMGTKWWLGYKSLRCSASFRLRDVGVIIMMIIDSSYKAPFFNTRWIHCAVQTTWHLTNRTLRVVFYHKHNHLADRNYRYKHTHTYTRKHTRTNNYVTHRPVKYALQLVIYQYSLKNCPLSLFLHHHPLPPPPPPPPLSIHTHLSTLKGPYKGTSPINLKE